MITGTHYATGWSAIVLLSMIFYVASYATGLGNVPWQQGELFSLEGKPCRPSGLDCIYSLITSLPPYPNSLIDSPGNWHVIGNRGELGRKPAHRLDVLILDGQNHPGGCFWVLRGSLLAWLVVLRVLLP